MSSVKHFVKTYKMILKKQNEIKQNHQNLVGLKVKMSPKYRRWLKQNIDGLTDYKGDELLEDIISKKANEATIISTSVLDHYELNIQVKFTDGRTKYVGLEDVV